jgi:DNA-binding transcriptional LysR family regulator
MAEAEPGWELYRTFLAAVNERSLSAAGRVLSLTQPTVGRHIDALEQALGAVLFTRSQAGLTPTAGALALVPHAEAMHSAARAFVRAASAEEQEERGAVRVTASEVVGALVLPHALASFHDQHPRIDIELVLSNRAEDLLRRDADIAVRMVKPTQSSLIAKKLGTLHLGLHADLGYLKRHGTPRTLEELRHHALIGFDRMPSVRALPATPLRITRDLFAFRCDSDLGQYAALRAGFGLGVCQYALRKRDGLVRVLPGVLEFSLGVWMVMHRDLRTTNRVRLVFDHLVAELKAYIASER